MDTRLSITAAFSSSHPRSAAALIIAYSPDTWYAAIGSDEWSLRARIMSRYAPAGFTIMMSAPSISSSAASRSASR